MIQSPNDRAKDISVQLTETGRRKLMICGLIGKESSVAGEGKRNYRQKDFAVKFSLCK